MTDWQRVRDNLLAIVEVLHWAAKGEDLHLIPEEFASLDQADQDEILSFLEGAVEAIKEAQRDRRPQ